ncbi:MAG: hypothetical protein ABSG82_04515 [Sedimentisphaerales bacterium]|jgi:hypothetical protein
MIKLLVIGAVAWGIIGCALMPAYMTLTSVIINENLFSDPQSFLNTWLSLTLYHLLAGFVWSLAITIPAVGFGAFFLKIQRWKWLRILGGIVGAVLGLALGPVYDSDTSFRFAGVAWFLIEGYIIGSWLTGIIAQRAIEGAFIVGIRLPNAFKALVIFVATGAVVWAMVGFLGMPTLLGAAEWSLHPSTLNFSPTPGADRAVLLIGWKLSPLCGIVHGFIAFLVMTWNLSPRRMPQPIPMPFGGLVDYREIRGQIFSIVSGILLWAFLGYWIASTGYPNGGGGTGALVGGFFGLAAGGGLTFAMDIARRTLLFPRL